MMTLDEAVKQLFSLSDGSNLYKRHEAITEELLQNVDVLKLLLVLHDEATLSTSNALIKALKVGMILGIEMEKIPQQ